MNISVMRDTLKVEGLSEGWVIIFWGEYRNENYILCGLEESCIPKECEAFCELSDAILIIGSRGFGFSIYEAFGQKYRNGGGFVKTLFCDCDEISFNEKGGSPSKIGDEEFDFVHILF